MLRKNLILLYLLSIASVLQAQKYEFGKVELSELQQKVHPKDSTASAAILYKIGKVDMKYENEWLYTLEVAVRTKVYKKEGYPYATVEVPLYVGDGVGDREKLIGLKAFTYNLEGDKMVKEKLKSDGEFEDALSENWVLKKFTFPNVKEGSVLEYSYIIVSQYITTLPEWKFQYDIPLDFIEYATHIPEYFNYNEFNKGYFPIQREVSTNMRPFNFRYEYNEPGASAVGAHKSNYQTLDCKVITSKYTGLHIPKITAEAYVNNINNYRTSIKHELSWSKMPNSIPNYYNQSWESVAKKVYEYDSFGKELNRDDYFEADLKPLLAMAATPAEKTGVILNFIRQKINWNGNFGIGCDKGVKEAYKNGTGNVAEINLMLTAMLRSAGVKANPVLVSTRANGIPLFPTVDGFNYVICAIEIENGLILLDATSKYSEPNVLPERALNWFGRLVRKDGSSTQVSLMPVNLSKELVTLNFDLKDDGTLTGKYRKQYTNHAALLFRQYYNGMEEEKYQEQIENAFGDIDIEAYEVEHKFDIGKPVIESFSFVKENGMDIIGDKIYFSPLFFLAEKENPFKLESRQFPVDFSFPKSKKFMININLPEGYTISSLPEAGFIKLPDDLGSFKYLISNKDKSLQLVVNADINAAIIAPDYYGALKEFYKQLVDKEAEKIVLTKIQ